VELLQNSLDNKRGPEKSIYTPMNFKHSETLQDEMFSYRLYKALISQCDVSFYITINARKNKAQRVSWIRCPACGSIGGEKKKKEKKNGLATRNGVSAFQT
jgi:hypothetical protein